MERKAGASIVQGGFGAALPAYALGTEWNEKVLPNSEGVWSSKEGWDLVLKRIFPGSVMAMDGKEHLFQRRLMSQAFKKDKLKSYHDQMNPLIEGMMNDWSAGDFKVYPAVKTMTLNLAVPIFMGIDLSENTNKINQAFVDTVEASIALIRLPLPFTPMRKGVKGRKFLVKEFRKLIPLKRSKVTDDFFSQFCHAETEAGEKFTDDQIINHMIFLMMAAHDTTTSTLSTIIYALAKHPQWQELLREKARTINEKHLPFDRLDDIPEYEYVMQEALRLYPPLPLMLRRTTKAIECNGFKVGKGRLVAISPTYTHHMESLWSKPMEFDPLRFSPERGEQKNHRYAWIPFGGGAHMCLGQHFATSQVRAFMHQLLLNFKWSVDDDYEMPYQLMPIAKPRDNLPIRLERITQ